MYSPFSVFIKTSIVATLMPDWFTTLLNRLLGRSVHSRIDDVSLSFGAAWTQHHSSWLWAGLLAGVAVAVLYYWRFQSARGMSRIVLATLRGALFVTLMLILAEPVLEMKFTDEPKPLLWVLADDSDSMNLVDDLPPSERERNGEVAGLDAATRAAASRADFLKGLLENRTGPLAQLSERFRVDVYGFSESDTVHRLPSLNREQLATSVGATSVGVTSVGATSTQEASTQEVVPAVATPYVAQGSATAIGSALEELRRRHPARDLAGVLIVSDFVQNAGKPAEAAAARLRVPVFTVGLGAEAASDLIVGFDAEPSIKRAERTSVTAILRQTGLTGRTANVRLTRAPADLPEQTTVLQERSITLDGPQLAVDFSVTPDQAGRFTYAVTADELPGETIAENNAAGRIITVTDDYLRLLFVEYEPTWEWRFVKEVFHRDPLVGIRGFRTYLRSSDPTVRETNELFLRAFPPPREEFFQYDVIFLGDLSGAALPGRFSDMLEEFVSQFGGGLVVMAGPRFGPQELVSTPIANMLPVVLDPDARRRDRPFRMQFTPAAAQYDFLRLGESEQENREAWNNLGPLPWYQPVRRVESTAVVLAEHPTDTLADGITKQPIMARRAYGGAGGEVVYVGTNETWRLRRLFGEKYYRQFWGQLIYRLGLGHARGADKRFVVDALPDAPFSPGVEIPITVRVWDRDFQRLTDQNFPNQTLSGQLISPDGQIRPVSIPMSRAGVFETQLAEAQSGNYRLKIQDPMTSEVAEIRFNVADVSVERRVATRDVGLQGALANAVPGGKSFEFAELSQLVEDFQPPPRRQTTTEVFPLWNTWLVFGFVLILLFAEWLLRKAVNLI